MIGKNLLVLILAFVTVFAAGAVLERVRTDASTSHKPTGSWLDYQLNLTPEQSAKIKAIFANSGPNVTNAFDARRQLEKQREQAIDELLTTEQLVKYQKIQADYHAKSEDLRKTGMEQFVAV